jgi:hypothetical protein
VPSPPNDHYALVGKRLGFRLAYIDDLREDRETWGIFRLDDQPVKVRYKSATIHDVINDTPNTCALTIDAATPPHVGQRLTVRINSNAPRTLFAGPLQTVDLTFELQPHQTVYPCQAIDDTPLANRKLPYGQWVNTPANQIATYLVVTFCPAGFSDAGVQPNLPPVSVNFDSTEGMDGCLRQLAKLIGGYFYWEDRVLHLFLEEPADAPDPIDDVHPFLLDPAIGMSVDTSQVRTRTYGKGHGEEVVADVAANDTIIPVSNAVMFNPAGGLAVTETQRLGYTGTAAGGGGTVVGSGVGPAAAPNLALGFGAGVPSGLHYYAVTFLTAAGESLISPYPSIAVGASQIPAPPAPTVTEEPGSQGFGGPGTTIKVWVTYSTASGETTAGPMGSVVLVLLHGAQQIRVSNLGIGPAGTTKRTMYLGGQGGGWNPNQILWQAVNDNVTTSALFPNTAPTFSMTGQVGPPTNTAGTSPAGQVNITAIPLGAATVTGRKLYRTAANAPQLKLLATIADNTTTTYLDVLSDASLGANAPTADTSGLKQPDGVVLAGAPSIVVAGIGWARPGGGWAIIGNGEQTIRYTGISGNTLTGIPAIGPGAIVATVSYNSTITAAAALLGVTGLLRALIKGAPINLWVQRDDIAAQASLAAADHTDGIIEHLITDERRGEASLTQLCDADLAQFAQPIYTVPYATRDPKTKSGKPVAINLDTPAIHTTLTIQEVTITEINVYPRTPPKFTVSASSVRFSLEDMLRRLGAALDVTT